VGSFPCVRSV